MWSLEICMWSRSVLSPSTQASRVQLSKVQAYRRPESKRQGVQSPSVQSPRVQASGVQVSSRPESKRPGVQSPSTQASRVQSSKVQASRCPESKRPDHASGVQIFRYASVTFRFYKICVIITLYKS